MEKQDLMKYVEMGLSFSEMSRRLNIHRTTISKLCKKYELSTNIKHKKNTNCCVCGVVLKNNKSNRKNCQTCITRIRRYRLKKRAVEHKGGKCIRCGFDKNIEALIFHHKNPNDKMFGIAMFSYRKWELLVKELDKCDLLCANCHSIEHSKYNDEIFLKYINDYQ